MDFKLSADQTTLCDSVKRYLAQQYATERRRSIVRDPAAGARERWSALAELGWFGIGLSEQVGGYGGSILETALLLEQVGRDSLPEPLLACGVLAPRLITECAAAGQREALLEPVLRGELLYAVAHSEMHAHGNEHFVQTRARARPDGGWVLSGAKTLIVGGALADRLLVSARTSGADADPNGISLFVLPPDARGVALRRYHTIDGMNAADATLSEVAVGAEALLGTVDMAGTALSRALDAFALGAGAEALGAMESIIHTTADYLKLRRAYGTTLSTFQALQHRLADMICEREISRSILYRAIGAMQSGDPLLSRRMAAAARATIGRASRFIAGHGIQLHGATGVVEDHPVATHFKRLTVLNGCFGTPESHLSRYVVLTRFMPNAAHSSLARDTAQVPVRVEEATIGSDSGRAGAAASFAPAVVGEAALTSE